MDKLVLQVDVSTTSLLVDLAIKKDYKTFVKKVLGSVDGFDKLVKDVDYNIEPFNIINGCCFVVRDMENFIEPVKNKGYNINAGPQAYRGRVNSINNFLSILDMEYRKSLYNHNNYHTLRVNVYIGLKLSKDKFSFNNIHMNIGGVRSSPTFYRNRDLPKNRDDLIQVCFQEVDGILKQKMLSH